MVTYEGVLRALLPRACEAAPLARVPWLALCAYLYAQGERPHVSLDLQCQRFVEEQPAVLVPRAQPYAGQRPKFRRSTHVSS